jgi:hypothetical protein
MINNSKVIDFFILGLRGLKAEEMANDPNIVRVKANG